MEQPAPAAPAYRTIEFNALDPQTRQRFVDALAGTGSPVPVLSAPSLASGAIVGWCFLALIGLSAIMFLGIYEYGSIYSYSQSPAVLLLYAASFFLAAWSVLRAVRTARLAQEIPFVRGRYVFPTDMVIATSERLVIVPMGRLLKLDGVHRHVNGVYQGTDLNFQFEGYGRECFTVRGKMLAEEIMEDLRVAQRRISEAMQFQDVQVLAAMDVFFEARITEQWSDPIVAERLAKEALALATSGGPATYRTPDRPDDTHEHKKGVFAVPSHPVLQRAALLSLGAALLAVPFWLGRNFTSDEAAFNRARQINTTHDFQDYLHGEGRHSQEVIDQHLPEAAFAQAQRDATVAALRDFVRGYPQSARIDEARAAIHERFVQVRQDFMTQAATGDPTMPVFMGRLLDWLEAHDSPPVQVRFLAPSAEALATIDENLEILAQLEGVTGGIAPVAPHFTAERSSVREHHITEVLQRGFTPVFPSDVMLLEHAGRIDTVQQQASLTQPAFDVSYSIRPSGSVYTSDTSSRGFVGISVEFHIQMRFPDSADGWGFDTNVLPPEHFTVTSYGLYGVGGADDGAVYTTMADRAFDQLGTQLALTFFRPDTAAYAQAQAAAESDMRGDADERPTGLPAGLPPGLLDSLRGLDDTAY